jgi:hypothetical protein
MRMKIFAFSTDDRGLIVFARKEDAISYCEGVDIENGEWIFWDECGINMEAKFSTPNKIGKFTAASGKYDLVSFPEGLELIEFLSNVGYVEGNGIFKDINEIRQHLTKLSN